MTIERPERERIWIALSELFLDTEVSLGFDNIVRELSATSFTIEELYLILRDEVMPTCMFNLFDPAGEWAGFSEDWLISTIRTYLSRPAWRRRFGRRKRTRMLRLSVPEWPDLKARIENARAK